METKDWKQPKCPPGGVRVNYGTCYVQTAADQWVRKMSVSCIRAAQDYTKQKLEKSTER